MHWWERLSDQLQGVAKEGLNSLIILGFWILWNHRNPLCHCVFDKIPPNLEAAIKQVEEGKLWKLAGAKNLALLTMRVPC
jgi:hypothetical protein